MTDIVLYWNELENLKAELCNRIQQLTPEKRQFRTKPESWNILGVMQHLMLVETKFLHHLKNDPPLVIPKPPLPLWLGKIVVWAVMRFEIKVKTPTKGISPKAELTFEEIKTRWDSIRIEIGHQIDLRVRTKQLDKSFYHPVSGWKNLDGGLKFFLTHFKRHVHQVERIIASPSFPKS